MACCGCGEKSPKGTSPAKNAEQGTKGEQPAAKVAKPVKGEPAKPPAGKPEASPEKSPAAKPEASPEKPEQPASAEAGSTSGRGGRAVGKVLKRLMEKPEGGKAAKAPPF